jgi:hypothetical protein
VVDTFGNYAESFVHLDFFFFKLGNLHPDEVFGVVGIEFLSCEGENA